LAGLTTINAAIYELDLVRSTPGIMGVIIDGIVIVSLNKDRWQAVMDGVSDWIDVSGWTDKVLSVASAVTDGSGNIDLNIYIFLSPKDKYVLDNEATVDTQDYQVITVVDNLTTGTLATYDAQDIDELQRPTRSMLVALDNGDGTDSLTVDIWIEGWS